MNRNAAGVSVQLQLPATEERDAVGEVECCRMETRCILLTRPAAQRAAAAAAQNEKGETEDCDRHGERHGSGEEGTEVFTAVEHTETHKHEIYSQHKQSEFEVQQHESRS